MTTPHVGMKLWQFNPDRRVYARDERGRPTGRAIWIEHWEPVEILGETKVSWLIGPSSMKQWNNYEKHARKLPKRSFPGHYAVSDEDISRRAFVEAKRIELSQQVLRCNDYDTLKLIDAALSKLAEASNG